MKKIILLLQLIAFSKFSFGQGNLIPNELLTISFLDGAGARDTVYIGHYYDSCYLYIVPQPNCPKVVSPGIDSAFGEVDLGSGITPGVFTARIENLIGDGFSFDWYTKYDIRYCDLTAEYAIFYNFFNDPLNYKIRLYNYTLPVIASISINRNGAFLADSSDYGCFCEYSEDGSGTNPNEKFGNGWYRAAIDSFSMVGFSKIYDEQLSPSLIDTISVPNLDYYLFAPMYILVNIFNQLNNKNAIKVYPIPAENFLCLENNTSQNLEYSIFSVTGKEILSGKISSNVIDISTLGKGQYMIRLRDEKNIFNNYFIKL